MRQEKVVEMVENGGNMSKGEILRKAGYSEAVVKTPQKVFGSPTVQVGIAERAAKLGVSENLGFRAVKEAAKATHLTNMTFPLSEELTDKDIITMLKKGGCVVRNIVYGKTSRRVYYWSKDYQSRLRVADMIFKIYGTYAPKKVEGKQVVGSFSLKKLREWRQENGESPLKNDRRA